MPKKYVEVQYKGDLDRIYLMFPFVGDVKKGDTLKVEAKFLDDLKEVGFVEVKQEDDKKDKGGEK